MEKQDKKEIKSITDDKQSLIDFIDSISWFLGPWKANIWKKAITGMRDYKDKIDVIGFIDAHIHIDRYRTYHQKFLPEGIFLNQISNAPLEVKQDLVGMLHDGEAYKVESLAERMEEQILREIKFGVREMWAVSDTTTDIGLRALNVLNDLKNKYKKQIKILSGCYPVFGLGNAHKDADRFKLIDEASEISDFIIGLPEKDEAPDRIGFKGHVNWILELGYKRKIPVHIHVDQTNSAFSKESFKVIECLRGRTHEKLKWYIGKPGDKPKLWLVHVLSPSSYDAERFSKLVKLLVNFNIGVIVCPRAALSMRVMRSELAPIHNSIARVTEMINAGVTINLGTDNVNDIFVPSGDGNILTELDILWDLLRCYSQSTLLKIAMGMNLSNGDKALIGDSIRSDNNAWLNHSEMINQKIDKTELYDF